MQTSLPLLPDFAILFLGVFLRRFIRFGDHFWAEVERLVFYILFPILLFYSLSRTTFDFHSTRSVLIAVIALIALGMVFSLLPQRWMAHSGKFASVFQCGFRFNSYIAFGAAAALYGQEGVALMGLLIGVTVPLANIASVWMLARQQKGHLLRELVRNPLIWGTLLGLSANVLGLHPQPPLSTVLQNLAQTSVILGLLAVGAALRIRGDAYIPKTSIYYLVLKLIGLPLLALLLSHALALSPLPAKILILYASLPVATSAYIMAVRMSGDGASVAWLISASTLLSMLSMPLWVIAANTHVVH